MSSQFVVTVTDINDQKTVSSEIGIPGTINANQPDAWAYLRTLGNYFHSGSDGAKSLNVTVQDGTVSATGTVTFSSIAAADTVTIGGTVFTGSNSPSGAVQFLTGTTDTLSAVSLASVIKANTTVNKLVSATSSGAVITLTAVVSGPVSNFITLAISAHGSVSGATLTGGTVVGQGTVSEGV